MDNIEKQLKTNLLLDDTNDNDTNDNDTSDNDIININDNDTNDNDNNTNMGDTLLELSKTVLNAKILETAFKARGPSCGLIVVDNFYNNAQNTRDYILTQEFTVRGNFPGQRTISYANEHLRDIIQGYIAPFGGKITDFPMPLKKEDEKNDKVIYNGSFQYTTSRERSWIHADGWNNWAGVLYLTPNAPLSAGTSFYRFKNGEYTEEDAKILNTKDQTDKYSQDLTKWEKVDSVGNVFNRLILFNSKRFHMSMDYFGDTKENSRLFQVFFFSTER